MTKEDRRTWRQRDIEWRKLLRQSIKQRWLQLVGFGYCSVYVYTSAELQSIGLCRARDGEYMSPIT